VEINDLYERARCGSPADEQELFAALSARFRLVAHHRLHDRQDAEDVVQESLAVIYGEYRDLRVHSSFAAWAFTVLRNRMLAYFDKQGSEKARVRTFTGEEGVPGHGQDERLASLRRKLLVCLQKIGRANIRYARIINLHQLGYDTEEICEKLGITASNFYSILSRGRDMLTKCLEETPHYGK
jgi:RNA polymerase sigma-70 factor, ECF subfamily